MRNPFKRSQPYGNPWRAVEERDATFSMNELLAMMGRQTVSGVTVTPETAMRHSAVWACVRLLADSISTMPIDVFRGGSNDPIEPLPQIMQQPSADMDMPQFLWASMASLLLRGNAWGQIVDRYGNTMLPAQVELLDPDRVSARYEGGRKVIRIDGRPVDPSSMWHVKAYYYPRRDDLEGMSPIRYAAESIGLGLAAEEYGASWFDSGGVPSGVFKNKEKRFDKDDVAELRKVFTGAHRRRARSAVIGSQWDYQQISIAPNESQFLETIKANLSTVARFYGVPPEMIGGEAGNSLTYSNVSQQSLHYLKYALTPWLVRLDKALSSLLPRPRYVKLKPDAILRATTQERYASYAVAIKSGFMTVDEARELENWRPLGINSSTPSNGNGKAPVLASRTRPYPTHEF